MEIRNKTQHRPRFSLATLLGVMAYASFSVPIVAAICADAWHNPSWTLTTLLVMFPFLLPSLVTAVVLWQGMIESISRTK